MVEQLVGLSKLVVIQVVIHLGTDLFGAVKDPPVGVAKLRAVRQRGHSSTVHERELGGVKELGSKVAGSRGGVGAKRQVHAGVGAAGKGKAQRIRTVIAHPIHRVNAVAQGLGHLAALLIADQAVQVQILERNLRAAIGALTQKLRGVAAGKGAEHHHASYPEEQDVVGGDQHVGGIELLQIRGLFWPAQGGKWPQRGGEPGIQHVRILLVSCRRLLIWADTDDVSLAVLAFWPIPDRNAVAPPQLAGDAPIVHVIDPFEVARLERLRVQGGITLSHGVARGLGHLGHVHEPLQGQARLDRLAGALRVAHGVDVRADFLNNAALFAQCLADLHAGFLAGQAVEAGAGIGNVAGGIDDRGHVQVVAGAHCVVIRVVRRGDLHRTGTEFHVHVVIGDDLELQVITERVRQLLAHQIGVALIVWVYGNSDVAQHGFHTGGGHDEVRFIVIERAIADGDQLALDVLVHDLDIGDGGL